MKVALAQINPTVGAIADNCQKITEKIAQAKDEGAELVLFPEMALPGYFPHDLLLLPSFIEANAQALKEIIASTLGIAAVVGCVRQNFQGERSLFNSAAIIENGQLLGYHDKILLPTYDVFSERRYFEPGRAPHLWTIFGHKVAVFICEDIWQHAEAVEYAEYARDPIAEIKREEPDLLLNLSASPFYRNRLETRLQVCRKAALSLNCPLYFCNQVGGNDSLIFDGYSLIVDPLGNLVQCAKGFQEDLLLSDTSKLTPHPISKAHPLEDLLQALILGVKDYFHKLKWKKACLGLSGGIDSALVAFIAVEALGKENVSAIFLPSRYSSSQSEQDAKLLAHNLGISFEELSIEAPFTTILETLDPYFQGLQTDVTEENLQARIRGVLLMAFANKFHYLLLSTSNKSEMAMGYATLYGDMCGALAVLADVTKEQVYALAHYINRTKQIIPQTLINRPPTAELRFNQKDSDALPEYPIVDQVLQGYVEEHLSPKEIAEKHALALEQVKELVRKIHLNEYKRRQGALVLRVTKKAFSAGRIFPIVHQWDR